MLEELGKLAQGANPISAVLGIVNTAVDRLVPDRNAAEKLKGQIQLDLAEGQLKGQLAQLEVNKIEAANPSLFVSGGRPFIIWVCGSALAFQFVLAPIGLWVAQVVGHPLPMPPTLDEHLWELIVGMLGMSGWRSWDKMNGVASK